ncbi:MAG: 3-deoxy-D-manno-octulosonic acid transferase [Syntrophobacterales bacterium]|nr:MAG: 3-deoxy-D-manno-octulosonic acid transferase [Syntrophobacterales bacterium]
MINSLYNTLLTLGLVLSSPFFALKILTTPRYRRGLSQRLGICYKIVCKELGDKKPLWIHAASVGEVLVSLPIIKGIKQANPQLPILVSTMTASGNDMAKKRASGVKAITFFPLDHPWAARRTISLVNPRAFLVAETEIWPNFLMELGRKEIPIILFNGRISTRSLQWYKRFRFFIASPLAAISAFCMQSGLDAQRIIEMGADPERVTVTGNIKFDQPPPEITPQEKEALLQTLGLHVGQSILIAGSTHRGEDECMLKVLRRLSPEYPDLVLILAPRHLERVREVETLLKSEKIPWKRKSQLQAKGQRGGAHVILLDTLGELSKIYSIGTLVFVGGSLVRVGGHNVLEPLFFAKPVLFGPFMDHFREISVEVLTRGAGFQVRDTEEMVLRAKTLLENSSLSTNMGKRGFEIIRDNRGATRKTLETIFRFL